MSAKKSGSRPIQFMLGAEPRTYFDKLERSSSTGKFKVMLQKYWLCAQIGMVFDRKAEPVDTKHTVDRISPPLKEHAHLMRALAFWKYSEKLDLDPNDEDDMLPELKKFFDEDSLTKLGNPGLNTFDDYAAGGFEIIRDNIPNPTDLADFLVDYVDLLLTKTTS